MNVLQRFSATVTQSLDKAVCQLENQDAVASAALRQVRANAANAKVRLASIERDRDALADKLDSLHKMTQRWTDRARLMADQDETKALECLRRRQQCQNQAATTEQALAEYQSRIHKLQIAVNDMQQRLQDMTQERNLLRTRDSVAQAQRSLIRLQDDDCCGLDAVYDRWRARIYATEDLAGTAADDLLAYEFEQQETDAQLRAELAQLRGGEQGAASSDEPPTNSAGPSASDSSGQVSS